MTSTWLDNLTRATLRKAEFGFLGVVVYTRVHTPRRCGEPLSAGVLDFERLVWRPLRTNWLIVGTTQSSFRFKRFLPEHKTCAKAQRYSLPGHSFRVKITPGLGLVLGSARQDFGQVESGPIGKIGDLSAAGEPVRHQHRRQIARNCGQ